MKYFRFIALSSLFRLYKRTRKPHLSSNTLLFALFIAIQFLGCDSNNKKSSTQVAIIDTTAVAIDSNLQETNHQLETLKKSVDTVPEINEELMQRAIISKTDSSFHVYSNIRADYRIIGYQFPVLTSKKLVLFSVFTTDVQDNPHRCTYGSYYGSPNQDELLIKYTGDAGSFVQAKISRDLEEASTVYFEKRWVEFE